MVIITIGEMIVSPVAQALVARLAPGDMRGRYMAIYGFTWMIPAAIGPLAAGIVMDNYNPDWVWYLCGMLGTLTVLVFLGLHSSTEKRLTKHSETRQASRAPTTHPAD